MLNVKRVVVYDAAGKQLASYLSASRPQPDTRFTYSTLYEDAGEVHLIRVERSLVTD